MLVEGNPGPGGWGAVLRYPSHTEYRQGCIAHTTNNRMELTAAIEGLKALPKDSEVALTTDSQYVKNGITLWIKNGSNAIEKQRRQAVKNSDLWILLDQAVQQHKVQWHWVRGHSGHFIMKKQTN